MDRLRALSGTQRFALVILGIVVASIGRSAFDGVASTMFVVVGSIAAYTALGLVELAVWAWHVLQRRLSYQQDMTNP